MVHKIYSMFDAAEATREINSGELITEQAGYMPPHIQIQDMFEAGMRLNVARLDRFDFEGDVPDDFIDPTRSPNFDLADASRLGALAEERLENQKAAAAARKKEEEEKKKGEIPNG
nr:MAG: hypothetical protein [Microviridae sp.]